MASAIFCENCGTLNGAEATVCVRCRAPLAAAGLPGDDGFLITQAGVDEGRAGGWAARDPIPEFDDLPVAPRRMPVGTTQQIPMVPGIPADLIKPPELPAIEGAEGFFGLFKKDEKKKEGGPPVEVEAPKWLIALVGVLGVAMLLIVAALGFKQGPFDDKPVTATAEAERTQVANVFVTQTVEANAVQATAFALSTVVVNMTETAVPLATGTAITVARTATQLVIDGGLAAKDATAGAIAGQLGATQTVLSDQIAAKATQLAAAQATAGAEQAAIRATAGADGAAIRATAGAEQAAIRATAAADYAALQGVAISAQGTAAAGQTAEAGSAATIRALNVEKSIQATMNALLTVVAPKPGPLSDSPGLHAAWLPPRPTLCPPPVSGSADPTGDNGGLHPVGDTDDH